MNCKVFHNNVEDLINRQLSNETCLEMIRHIENCATCAQDYALDITLNKVVEEDQLQAVNLFMSTRVMAKIEAFEVKSAPQYTQKLKPVFFATLLVITILTGILAGSFYNFYAYQQTMPDELVYMNDAEIEFLQIIENE